MPTIIYKNKKFHLKVSLRYDADDPELERWRKSFQQASKLLYHATNKQIQFGEIKVYNDSTGSYFADAYLHPLNGNSTTAARMHLCADERYRPFVIIHELGHYAFDLHDEYTGPSGVSGTSYCSDDANTHRCVMEFCWMEGDQIHPATGVITTGKVREFCFDDDHHQMGSPETNLQEYHHGKGCWDSILDIDHFSDLTIPAAARPVDHTGHEDVVWTNLSLLQRLIIILDNSASMNDVPGLKGFRNATRLLIEYFALPGEWLGMESGDGSDNPVFVVQPIMDKPTRDAAMNALQNAPLISQPDNRNALIQSLNRYEALDQAVNQTVLLFRSGPDNPFPVDELIKSSQKKGVRVHTVSVDDTLNSPELENLSTGTGGLLEYIPGDVNEPQSTHAVQNAVTTLLDGLIDNTGLLTRKTFFIPASASSTDPQPQDSATTPVASPGSLAPDAGKDQAILVEQDAQRVTFVVNEQDERQTRFSVFRPDGRLLEPDNDRVRHVDDPQSLYAFYSVAEPEPGTWLMRVERDEAFINQIGVTTIAVCQNKNLNIMFEARQVESSNVIEFEASVWFRSLVGNLEPVVEVFRSRLLENVNPDPPRMTVLKPTALQDRNTGQVYIHQDGMYRGQVEVDGPGTYTIVARFVSAGTALKCDVCCDTDTWLKNFVPAFHREARRQVTVATS